MADESLNELDISVRTWNGLQRAGIATHEQLLGLSVQDVLNIETMSDWSKIEVLASAIAHARKAEGKKAIRSWAWPDRRKRLHGGR